MWRFPHYSQTGKTKSLESRHKGKDQWETTAKVRTRALTPAKTAHPSSSEAAVTAVACMPPNTFVSTKCTPPAGKTNRANVKHRMVVALSSHGASIAFPTSQLRLQLPYPHRTAGMAHQQQHAAAMLPHT